MDIKRSHGLAQLCHVLIRLHDVVERAGAVLQIRVLLRKLWANIAETASDTIHLNILLLLAARKLNEENHGGRHLHLCSDMSVSFITELYDNGALLQCGGAL